MTPAGLDKHGRALWAAISAEAPQLGARDRALLEQACRQADTVGQLERDVYRNGNLKGPIGELRQARLALSRLLGAIALPRAGAGTTDASERARHAANVRWGHERGEHPARNGASNNDRPAASSAAGR